jgi:hypothetical protein
MKVYAVRLVKEGLYWLGGGGYGFAKEEHLAQVYLAQSEAYAHMYRLSELFPVDLFEVVQLDGKGAKA